MSQKLSPIITAVELKDLIKSDHALTIVDASAGKDSKQKYLTEHIDNALFVDLESQLADIKPDAALGGRHPLPTLEQFSNTLSVLAITPSSHVVMYDDKSGANAAARFWWMLRAVGHDKVQVLDGGLAAARDAGIKISSGEVTVSPAPPYKVNGWNLPIIDIKEIDSIHLDKEFLIIDVRDAYRYNGESEPVDLVAGHIPGAVNIPFTTNLDKEGRFLSPEKLREQYLGAFNKTDGQNIVVHCGSGVTACHTILALAYADLETPRLYVGSWSEWSRNNRPMILKE